MQLKVLTYNTHLFIASPAAFFAETFRGIGLVAQDCLRSQAIVNQIAALNPDVVCLQEVWAPAMQECLQGQLAQFNYKYFYIPPNKGVDGKGSNKFFIKRVVDAIAPYIGFKPIVEEILSKVPSLVDALTATSGLLVASRYPISDATFEMYPDYSPDGSDDDLSKKGVAAFTVTLPVGGGVDVRMGTTHCFTNTDKGAYQLGTFAAPLVFRYTEMDRILLGDFNLHVKEEGDGHDDYGRLKEVLAEYGAVDVIQEKDPNIEDSYTIWQVGNSLSWLLARQEKDGKKPTEEKNRIDYVCFASADSGKSVLSVSKVSIFNKDPDRWTVPYKFQAFGRDFDELDTSDHYPVLVEFTVKT